MRIDKQTYVTWMDTLSQSRQVMLEQGAFGLYLPNEDRVIHTVKPSELPDGSVIKSSSVGLDFHADLKQAITAFNTGRADYVEIGPHKYSRKDGKVYGYHTHPADDHEVTPSFMDRAEMLKIGSPLEIILAGALLKSLPQMPFVIGYNPEYFPEGERDFSKFEVVGQRGIEEAKLMGVPLDILAQLVFLPHYAQLKPSLNIVRA